jgi:hypothetical protein
MAAVEVEVVAEGAVEMSALADRSCRPISQSITASKFNSAADAHWLYAFATLWLER